MTVTLTSTWATGFTSNTNGRFILTGPDGAVQDVTYPVSEIDEIADPVHCVVAKELSRQGGAATGTVFVIIV